MECSLFVTKRQNNIERYAFRIMWINVLYSYVLHINAKLSTCCLHFSDVKNRLTDTHSNTHTYRDWTLLQSQKQAFIHSRTITSTSSSFPICSFALFTLPTHDTLFHSITHAEEVEKKWSLNSLRCSVGVCVRSMWLYTNTICYYPYVPFSNAIAYNFSIFVYDLIRANRCLLTDSTWLLPCHYNAINVYVKWSSDTVVFKYYRTKHELPYCFNNVVIFWEIDLLSLSLCSEVCVRVSNMKSNQMKKEVHLANSFQHMQWI